VAIVLAQMIVEAPKYGAMRRAAAISEPSADAPTTNAMSSIWVRPRRMRRPR
jgi:hypothetical protein